VSGKLPPKSTKKALSAKAPKKKVTLALQGGASYGAFTWGVLDRLLEDDRIEVVGISGASAGALNAVAVAYGMDENGPEGARNALRQIWHRLSYEEIAKDMPVLGKKSETMNKGLSAVFNALGKIGNGTKVKAAHAKIQAAIIAMTTGKGDFFEDNIGQVIDFESMKKKQDGLPLFITATDIHNHKSRIFDRTDISAKSVKASCALPELFNDVVINGRLYWDGGFTENPAITPLKECNADDIIIIQTLPFLKRDGKDDKATDDDMLYELLFNSSVRKDVQYIQYDNARYDRDPEAAKKLGIKKIHTHIINSGQVMPSKLTMCFDRDHLQTLHDMGYMAADKFIEDHFDAIGKRSSFTMNTARPPSAHKRYKKENIPAPKMPEPKKKKGFWGSLFG
jgi:NTE family protein